MNELKIFNNSEFGEVRTVIKKGQAYFCLVDINRALEINNTSQAKSRLNYDGVISNEVIDSLGRTQLASFVNEPNLYKLIFQSRKANAEKFTNWVTSEVLPSIRQNGGYIANQENLTPEQIVANALIVAQNIILQRDKLITEMQPKADYFDELVERNLLTSFRDTAKEFGIKEKDFIGFLLSKSYVYRDANKKLKPYAEKNNGLFELKEFVKDNYVGSQTLITPKGRETFRLLIKGI